MAEDLFTNRSPTPAQGMVLERLPSSRFRSLAMTKLEECSMWAKKATMFGVGSEPSSGPSPAG